VRNHIVESPRPIEISRIILPRPLIRHIVKLPIKKRAKAREKVKAALYKLPPKHQPQQKAAEPRAHLHVLTVVTSTPASPKEPTALPGGNTPVGTPLAHENSGNAVRSPPSPVVPSIPQQRPQVLEPTSKSTPPPVQPTGPTLDAEPSNQIKPEIPDELKQDDYKSFVRVRVQVESDGNFTVTLRTSSGNEEIDQRVLGALRQWRWKPALQNGVPIKSTQSFRFEFEVQ
jgi:TonB family protein